MAITVTKEEAEVIVDKIADKMESAVRDGHTTSVFVILMIIAAMNDFADWSAIGSLPLVGDIGDVVVTAIIIVVLWRFNSFVKTKIRLLQLFGGLVELIPFVDVFPTYMVIVFLSWRKVKKDASIAKDGLRQLDEGEIDLDKVKHFNKTA